MSPVELNVFFHSEDSEALHNLDLDYPMDSCDVRTMLFMDITAIAPCFDGEKEFCSVFSNGAEFICVDNYKTVKNKINNGTK